MPRSLRLLIAFFLSLTSLVAARAATPPPASDVFRLQVTRDTGDVKLTWTIAAGNYLYRNRIKAADAKSPDTQVAIHTPPGQLKDDPNFRTVEVFHDAVTATIAGADLRRAARLVVTYQGCAEQFQICYPPVRKVIDLATLAISMPSDLDTGGREGVASPFPDAPPSLASAPQAGSSAGDSSDPPPSFLALGGTLASFFGFGLLLSFSPCTFPMVPIFFGLLARSSERPSAARGLGLAAAFVGASASAYALLGAFSAWSGSGENLQVLLQTPLALSVMSAVLVAFALSMFGLFDIQLPAGLVEQVTRIASKGRRGPLTAAAALGFAAALIAGPCVTPPLATALLYVARTGDVVRGMAALFVFGVGLGVPLLVFGALGPRFLPKPGRWLVHVRHMFGVILLVVAIWVLSRVLTEWLALQLWGALAVGLAVYLSLKFLKAQGVRRIAWVAPAALALLAGSVLLIGSAGDDSAGATRILARLGLLDRASDAKLHVVRSMVGLRRELAAARSEGKPAMVDFSADWCVECKLMDAVLENPALKKQLDIFRLVRADITDVNADSRAIMRQFSVVGPPTILLFGPQRGSAPEIRVVGLVDAQTLSNNLSAVAPP